MKKKEKDAFNQMDPGLRTALGFDVGPDEKSVPDELPDVIADAVFQDLWGFSRSKVDGGNPAPEKKALSQSEIAEALQNLSKTLNKPDFASTGQLIKALANAAESHLEEGNPVREWLIGYAAKDHKAMRSAIKKLVQASRDEITKHVAKGGRPLELLIGREQEQLPN